MKQIYLVNSSIIPQRNHYYKQIKKELGVNIIKEWVDKKRNNKELLVDGRKNILKFIRKKFYNHLIFKEKNYYVN
ncbi:MAG: hypothetical protein WC934_06385 [Acidithiobacillus sp.]|jgi:hypothetical protein|uniref:hypothetical protein n=1 Tax=Acidithiobacillus sp. TaxID=1872118 RepID=UPI00355F2DC3